MIWVLWREIIFGSYVVKLGCVRFDIVVEDEKSIVGDIQLVGYRLL